MRRNIGCHATAQLKLASIPITLTRDQLAGLALQNSLGFNPELIREVNQRVEQAMQAPCVRRVPDCGSMVRTINLVRQNTQHALEDGEDHQMPD
ncbi:hypothetical protein MJO28_007215 [Puccinia striiformis f. sp. tritici]|uniref:Uncharacterized protein n=1 Tax=Puccinia striiformis f. sp. tritici TaxID=168172 RepID=A0ACC0EDX8_9BASI|nr:hypothetical protein MJO28_007215 [Puccinia striiformis f. sp. tritici]